MQYHIQPAAQRIGITKRIGWRTFRRTYTTLLHANGEDVKVVQELLRHGSARITMDVYAQAMTSAKRLAHGKVVGDVAGRGKDEGIKLVCPHCVPGEKRGFRQVFYFVGVPGGRNSLSLHHRYMKNETRLLTQTIRIWRSWARYWRNAKNSAD